ncbi:MAG: HAMP domain-containing sensor histidine kinase [Burkholderiales bacterium]
MQLFTELFSSIERSARYSWPKYILSGALGAIGFPLYYFVWHNLFPQGYENLPLRIFGALVCLPLVFANHWSSKLRRLLPFYWFGAILFSFPFFFTFMLLMNNGSHVWAMSVLVAIMLLTLLVDWRNLILLHILGVSAAFLAWYFSSASAFQPQVYAENMPIFLFAIIGGTLLNFTGEMIKQERLSGMLATANDVAHELRTPLLGIKSVALGLNKHLPILLNGYELAKQHQLPVGVIRLSQYDNMLGALQRLEQEVDYSNTIIDMLLLNSKEVSFSKSGYTACSMTSCIQTAVERYPFASANQRSHVFFRESPDFNFIGSEIMMVHVFFNLIKNAIRAISIERKGDIEIWLHSDNQSNRVYVRDSGAGIPPEILPHVFERFYSWSRENGALSGTGVGLAFCKTAVESFGGRIKCESVFGEYTELILTFPAKVAT